MGHFQRDTPAGLTRFWARDDAEAALQKSHTGCSTKVLWPLIRPWRVIWGSICGHSLWDSKAYSAPKIPSLLLHMYSIDMRQTAFSRSEKIIKISKNSDKPTRATEINKNPGFKYRFKSSKGQNLSVFKKSLISIFMWAYVEVSKCVKISQNTSISIHHNRPKF